MSGPTLPVIYKKMSGVALDADRTAFCSAHELLACVDQRTQDITVFRLNGQAAFTIKHRTIKHDVTEIKFKPDGSILAIGYKDGLLALHSGETGKLVTQFRIERNPAKDNWKLDITPHTEIETEAFRYKCHIASVLWCTHVPSAEDVDTDQEAQPDGLTTEEWADKAERADKRDLSALSQAGLKALTEELAKLDVTTVLPKLSAIPTHGASVSKEAAKFTTQAGVDAVFDSTKTAHHKPRGSVDLLLVANGWGHVSVLLNDTEIIMQIDIQDCPYWQAAHPERSQRIFIHSIDQQGADVFTTSIEFPMELLGGPLWHVITTNTKRIHNLTVYITQTMRFIVHEWASGMEFPTRLIDNINEDLDEKAEGDLVANLTHLAMTGKCNETLRSFLVDVVRENNHKRWDQGVRNAYSRIQSLVFENLIPALDRLSIAVTELRGQARYYDRSSKFNVQPQLFTAILEGLDSLRMAAQNLQLHIITEQQRFAAFSKWLRVMVDICADPGTAGAAEIEERETPNFDYNLILPYIKDVLMGGSVGKFVSKIEPQSMCTEYMFFKNPHVLFQKLERTKTALQDLDDGKLRSTDEDAINMSRLTVLINGCSRHALESITRWQNEVTRVKPITTQLPPPGFECSDNEITDTRMAVSNSSAEVQVIMISNTHADLSGRVSRISQRQVRNTVTGQMFLQHRVEDKVFDGEVQNVAVLDDDSALVLVKYSRKPSLGIAMSLFRVTFARSNEPMPKPDANIVRLHVFEDNGRPKLHLPYHIIAGGRPGMQICVVLAKEGGEWTVLEIDRPGAMLRDP